jgi:hypothetical protein
MPSLRIVTWNSTGEDAVKAAELSREMSFLNNNYPAAPVRLVLNQEAQQGTGGAIYAMLNDPGVLGPAYTRPPAHIPEMPNGGGCGYTALAHGTLAVTLGLRLYDYGTDASFQAWLAKLPPRQRETASREVERWRPPAVMELTCDGSLVRLITWHAPLDQSGVLTGCTTEGGAPLDAFLFMDQSRVLPGSNKPDIIIIAGDLNMTDSDLGTSCSQYEPLRHFAGKSSGLDHILAWSRSGTAKFVEAERFGSHSVHDIFTCRVVW